MYEDWKAKLAVTPPNGSLPSGPMPPAPVAQPTPLPQLPPAIAARFQTRETIENLLSGSMPGATP